MYVLREAFGYPHSEIAAMLEISEANSQQLLRRAAAHVQQDSRPAVVDPAVARRITQEFLAAAGSGKTQPLVALLTGDAVAVSDGGGRVAARRSPVHGADAVAAYLSRLFRGTPAQLALVGGMPGGYLTSINGAPAVIFALAGQVLGALVLEVTAENRISAVRLLANPDKLERLSRAWTPRQPEVPDFQLR